MLIRSFTFNIAIYLILTAGHHFAVKKYQSRLNRQYISVNTLIYISYRYLFEFNRPLTEGHNLAVKKYQNRLNRQYISVNTLLYISYRDFL